MSFEMAMLMNWLLVAAGLLASDTFSGLFDDLFKSDDASDAVPEEEVIEPLGDNLGLGDGDDTYLGTDQGDFVLGQAGEDVIDGAAGDDTLEGNIGDDTLMGGAGADILSGGGDSDSISGGDGNDVLSSDRVDSDADWTRGDVERLDGGAGDDKLFFSSEDIATGGAGADTFGMIETDEGAARITDFDAAEDDVTIYVDGLAEAETPPILSYSTDEEADTTTVSLDGEASLVFDGVFTPEELNVSLADPDDIDFTGVA